MKLSLTEIYVKTIARKPSKKLTLESVYMGSPKLKEEPKNGILTPGDMSLMKDMEQEVDAQINQEVPLEEGLMSEKMGNKGDAYEETVIAALRAAKITGNITKGAGACSTCADADMMIYNKIFNVEVKLDGNAQMGGGSLRYKKGSEVTFTQEELDEGTKNLLISAVKNNSKKIDELVDFLSNQEPKEINVRSGGFPGTWTNHAWVNAGKKGLLFNTRKAAETTAEHISAHYAKKGVYYIQIGGAGLFYMNQNPAKLPIPKLEGKVYVELGTRPGGSRNLSSGIKIKSAGIRCQGRLVTQVNSPYTLDNPASITAMLKAIGSENKKPTASNPKASKSNRRKKPGNRRRFPVNKTKARG